MRTTGSTIRRAFARTIGTITTVGLTFLGLFVPTATAAELTVCADGCAYTAIQPAIDAASPGDTITIGEGTFSGALSIAKRLTIRGAGAGTVVSAGPTTISITAPIAGTARVVIQDLAVTGFTATGVLVTDFTTLDRVTVTGGGVGTSSYDVALPGLRPVSDVAIVGSTLAAATTGLKIPSTTGVDGLTIDGTTIQGTRYGIYADAPSPAVLGPDLAPPITDVAITDSTFAGNTEKGVYMERLSAAVLSGLTFTDNGTLALTSSRGLNLNLKYGSYSDITISDSTFTGNGTGTAYGAAITIAARDDGTTYSQKPAALTDLTISGVTVSGSPVGISLENHVDLATTLVEHTRLVGHTVAGLATSGTGAGTLTAAMSSFDIAATGYAVAALSGTVDARLDRWGDANDVAASRLVGTVRTSPWIHEYTDDPAKAGEPGFWPIDVTYASTPVTVAGGENPEPASFGDPTTGASISVDLPTLDTGGTLAVETLTKPGGDVANANFSAGSVFFDVTFDGTLGGPATICLTYPGGGNWPVGTKLYHYVSGAWTDVTTSLVGGVLCGTVTSFSPFAAGIVTLGSPPVVGTVTAAPETQAYGGNVTVTADVTDTDGAADIVTVEYALGPIDGSETWMPMTAGTEPAYSATIAKPDVGTYIVYVRATDAGANTTDPVAAGDSDSFTITTGASAIVYTGTGYLDASAPVRLEATVSGACKAGRSVTFTIDTDHDSDFDGDDTIVPAPNPTNSAGVATATVSLGAGIYDIEVVVSATGNCDGATGTSVLLIAGTGDSSNGGGAYTINGVGRVNFGYALQVKTDRKTQVRTVSGQIVWQVQGKYRMKGTITGYTLNGSCPAYVTSVASGSKCATVTGSGTVYEWTDPDAEIIGDESWVPIEVNTSFRVIVTDGGTSTVCLKKSGSCTTNLKADFFGITIRSAAIDPAAIPVDATNVPTVFQIKGGNVVVR